MIGLTIITHAEMAKGIQSAMNLILGEQEQFATVGLYEGADFDQFRESVKEAIVGVNDGSGVLILVDLYGASPYNASAYNMSFFQENNIPVRLVTGVNLPMVITAASMRDSFSSVDELYESVMEEAKDGIKEMMQELGM